MLVIIYFAFLFRNFILHFSGSSIIYIIIYLSTYGESCLAIASYFTWFSLSIWAKHFLLEFAALESPDNGEGHHLLLCQEVLHLFRSAWFKPKTASFQKKNKKWNKRSNCVLYHIAIFFGLKLLRYNYKPWLSPSLNAIITLLDLVMYDVQLYWKDSRFTSFVEYFDRIEMVLFYLIKTKWERHFCITSCSPNSAHSGLHSLIRVHGGSEMSLEYVSELGRKEMILR